MEKYIVNSTVHGYTTLDINDIEKASTVKNSFVAIVINKDLEDRLHEMYMLTDTLVRGLNNVNLISVEDDNEVLRPLACLMVAFKCYGIYTVDGLDDINSNFLMAVEERTPDITEVQSFIGGDITAYNDLATFLYGIETLVGEGNLDALKKYLDDNINNIVNLSITVDNMKTKCGLINSNDLINQIEDLRESNDDLVHQIEQQIDAGRQAKAEAGKLKEAITTLKQEKQAMATKIDSLESTASSSDGSIIKTYSECNTKLIKCKTNFIIYIKEISYVPYVNTLVSQLFMTITEFRHLRAKLVIYDTRGLCSIYKPLPILSGREYVENRDMLVNKTPKFVMTEPNQSVIEDILTSEQNFDVVIVYDRMREDTDIVSGNNVTKFFVIGSSKDYLELKDRLKINDTSSIITRTGSRIEGDVIDIPSIEKFSSGITDSARTSKYMKLICTSTGEPVMETIFKKSQVSSLF